MLKYIKYDPDSGSVEAALRQSIEFTTSLPFDVFFTYIDGDKAIDQAYVFAPKEPVSGGYQPEVGCMVQMRLIANGNAAHAPDFSAFKTMTGSQGWVNDNGTINLVLMYYDSTDYSVGITQLEE